MTSPSHEVGKTRMPLGATFGHEVRALAASLFVLGCASSQSTERVFNGELVVGPYVAPEAYAAFAEGVYLEQHGDYPGALVAYRRARARDDESPAIAARLGAVTCRTDLAAALAEFRTMDLARDFAPAWAERGLCLQRHRDAAGALDAARRAVQLEPGNPEANLLVATLHREAARPEAARAWLFAWALAEPLATASWRSIEAEARLLGDAALGALARSALSRADADSEGLQSELAEPVTAAAARSALIANARIEPELAAAGSRLALDANPADSDALVVALFAASVLSDEKRFTELLEHARADRAPAPEAASLLAELLRVRVGDDAAQTWLSAYQRTRTAPTAPPR